MSDSIVDRSIVCREQTCGKTFVFTAGEQRFFQTLGHADPVRCKECRARRKAQQNTPQQTGRPAGNTFVAKEVFGPQVESRKAAKPVEVQHRRPFGSKKRQREEYDFGDD